MGHQPHVEKILEKLAPHILSFFSLETVDCELSFPIGEYCPWGLGLPEAMKGGMDNDMP